jgi:O-antigen/teichoic acid export membrane protein
MYKNYYIYLITLPVLTLIVNILRAYYTKRCFPEFHACGTIANNEKKDVFFKLVPLMGHRLSGVIIASTDNIVISTFLGVAMVAVYNNYYTIIIALSTFIIAIYAAIQPGIGNSMAMEAKSKNFGDFKKLSFSMCWIVGWVSICLVCLFEDFISFSYGNQYQLGLITVILLALQFYIWRTNDLVMTYRDVVGKWSGDAVIPYISGMCNLVINLLLIKKVGVNGVILSTLFVFMFISIPFSLKVLIKNTFHESLLGFIKYYSINTSAIIVVGVVTYFICSKIHTNSIILQMAIKGIVCVFAPNILLIIVYHKKSEYKELKNKIVLYVKKRFTTQKSESSIHPVRRDEEIEKKTQAS